MHICCLQKVIGNFHLVDYRSYDVGSHVAFVVEGLQPAPDARPFIFDELRLRGRRVGRRVHGRVGVDPLLDFYRARAVVELVGYVGRLCGDVADLANEGDLISDLCISRDERYSVT